MPFPFMATSRGGETLDILVIASFTVSSSSTSLVSARMMTTSARFHMLNTLFMELVKALIDGAAKKGLMMTASQPLLHQHWILHKYVHIWNTHTFIYGTQIHSH